MQRNASAVDVWIFKSLFQKGLTAAAAAVDLRIRDYRDGLNAESLDVLRAAYSNDGLRGYWTKLRELLLPRFRSTANGVYRLAEINAYLDDKDEAFRLLNTYLASNPKERDAYATDDETWELKPLHDDPRWKRLLGK